MPMLVAERKNIHKQLEVVHGRCTHHVDAIIHTCTCKLLQHVGQLIELCILLLLRFLFVTHFHAKVHGGVETRHPSETRSHLHHVTDRNSDIHTHSRCTHGNRSIDALGVFFSRDTWLTESLSESSHNWQHDNCQSYYIFSHKFLIFIKKRCKVTQKAPNSQEFRAFYV